MADDDVSPPVARTRARGAALSADLIRTSPPVVLTARGAAATTVAMVGAAALVLARQRGVGALSTIWAEDASVFLVQARSLGAFRSFVEPYAGYMHAVPRLTAAVVSALPLEAADTGFAVASAGAAAGSALFVYRAASSQVRTTWARLACSAPLVIAPIGSSEILASAANLHWYLLYVAFWAVIWRAPSRWEAVLAAGVVIAATLSDPFTLLLLPLVAVRLLAAPRRPDAVVSGFVVAGIVQLAVVAGAGDQRALGASSNIALLPARYVVDVVGRGLVGQRVAGGDGLEFRAVAIAVIALAVLATLAFGCRGALSRRRRVVAAAMGVSAVYFLAPVALSGVSPPRYSFAPSLLLVAAVAVLLDNRESEGSGPPTRVITIPLTCVVALLWAIGLPSNNGRDGGPSWDAALHSAASRCRDGATAVSVPVTPSGWTALLSCRDIAHAVPDLSGTAIR